MAKCLIAFRVMLLHLPLGSCTRVLKLTGGGTEADDDELLVVV